MSGIIPARAGFTPAHVLCHAYHPDHPRSRGVYAPAPIASSPARGSSPLARGLRSGGGGVMALAGIIPARAGFTALPEG